LDLHMPELDGCRAARAIRSEGRNVSTIIVALTASVRLEDEARASAAGMDAYIRTPLESTALLAKLLQIGNTPRSQDVDEGAESQDLAPSSRGQSRALLDSRAALARVNGDQATYRRLLLRFLKTHAEDVQNISAARAQGDTERATQIVHTLASAAANIGASQLQRAALALESMLSCNASALTDWVTDLERCHQISLSAAAAALKAYGSPALANVDSGVVPSDLLLRARALIENHDTAAVDCVRVLSARLADQSNVQEPLKRLEASMESYDFELAQIELEALERAFATGERHSRYKFEGA
jgi:CheY-like chemotaxis protein